MLQRVDHGIKSVADYMIGSFTMDEALKESLRLVEGAIACIESNESYPEEVALLRLSRFAIREKIFMMSYS
jgi:hypothetical protein